MRLHPGESEATGWHVQTLSAVVQRLRRSSAGAAGRPHLFAVDGRGGTGKTVLTQRLRGLHPGSHVVHTDDIAWNHAYFDWAEILVDNVLRPLHDGRAVSYRPRAWIDHDRHGTIEIPRGADTVWVEGTGIIRGELRRWFDGSIYLQGDLTEQEHRLVARDGDSSEQRRHIAAWLAEELPLMLREQPWRTADVVATTSGLPHDPDTEIVIASAASAAEG